MCCSLWGSRPKYDTETKQFPASTECLIDGPMDCDRVRQAAFLDNELTIFPLRNGDPDSDAWFRIIDNPHNGDSREGNQNNYATYDYKVMDGKQNGLKTAVNGYSENARDNCSSKTRNHEGGR